MAYINERVTKEKQRIFEIPPYGAKFTPHKWTIDKEKNTILFHYITERDNPENEMFVFVYKDHVIKITLNGKEFVDKNTRKWKLIQISVPQGLNEEKVLNELREALTTYGCSGMPLEDIEIWKNKFNAESPNGLAIIDF
ncbi:MAG: hypothetical protein IKY44_00045 [Clostridia bacterium]|nr:hypothetical protein [Clostridia bacterium]